MIKYDASFVTLMIIYYLTIIYTLFNSTLFSTIIINCYHFHTFIIIRSKPSKTFPEVPLSTNVSSNIKSLREQYLKEYKAKQQYATFDVLGSTTSQFADSIARKMEEGETILKRAKTVMSPSSSSKNVQQEEKPILTQKYEEYIMNASTTNTQTNEENYMNKFMTNMQRSFIDGKQIPFMNAKKQTPIQKLLQKKHQSNGLGQDVDKAKTFLTGLISGGIAVAPVVAFQDIILKFSLSQDVIDKFYLDTSLSSFECALFSLIMRFCVREGQQDNDVLKNGIVASAALLRTSSQISGDTFNLETVSFVFCLSVYDS
jgi:hypothetical protein